METEFGKRIGRRLRELREQRDWTQAEFAELTSKTVETISNIERGKTIPGLLTLDLFAKRLGVRLEDLVRSDAVEAPPDSKHAAFIAAAAKRLPQDELALVAGVIGLLDKQRRSNRRSRA